MYQNYPLALSQPMNFSADPSTLFISLISLCISLFLIANLSVIIFQYKLLKKSFAIQVWFIIYHLVFCFQH